MSRKLCTVSLALSLSIGGLTLGGDKPVEPTTNGHAPPAPISVEKHPCLHRLWEFVTFRLPPLPRPCQECLAYPQQSCVPPLYRFMENRFPTVTVP